MLTIQSLHSMIFFALLEIDNVELLTDRKLSVADKLKIFEKHAEKFEDKLLAQSLVNDAEFMASVN